MALVAVMVVELVVVALVRDFEEESEDSGVS